MKIRNFDIYKRLILGLNAAKEQPYHSLSSSTKKAIEKTKPSQQTFLDHCFLAVLDERTRKKQLQLQ